MRSRRPHTPGRREGPEPRRGGAGRRAGGRRGSARGDRAEARAVARPPPIPGEVGSHPAGCARRSDRASRQPGCRAPDPLGRCACKGAGSGKQKRRARGTGHASSMMPIRLPENARLRKRPTRRPSKGGLRSGSARHGEGRRWVGAAEVAGRTGTDRTPRADRRNPSPDQPRPGGPTGPAPAARAQDAAARRNDAGPGPTEPPKLRKGMDLFSLNN
jgi:hypothetical protein